MIEIGDKIEYIGADQEYREFTPERNKPYTAEGFGKCDCNNSFCSGNLVKVEELAPPFLYDLKHWRKLEPFDEVVEKLLETELVPA